MYCNLQHVVVNVALTVNYEPLNKHMQPRVKHVSTYFECRDLLEF